MVNRPFLDFVHPEDHAATSDEMQKLASGEPTFGFVNRYRRNDGRNCWLEWNALPFPDEGVVYAVARDVSAEHEAAQRIRELTSALQATERINSGVTLNDVLDAVYDGLHGAIPYNRVCIAKLDAGKERVHAECVKSDRDVLLPKALMRVKAPAGELLPGEPDDAKELSRRIDAPIGDRSAWSADWPEDGSRVHSVRSSALRARGARRHRDHLRTTGTARSRARWTSLPVKASTPSCSILRSLHPYDWEAIAKSVRKTGRVVVLNEDTEITNFGEHLIRRIVEELFTDLRARPRLEAGKHLPGEWGSLPRWSTRRCPLSLRLLGWCARWRKRAALPGPVVARVPSGVPLPSHFRRA